MKYALTLVILLSVFNSNVYSQTDDKNTFKLLCLNSWMIPFKRKKANTRAKLIGKYSREYDFVMLQEVFNRRQRKLITREINRGEWFDNRYQTTPLFRINSGVFNLSKYKIIKSSFKRFSNCGGAQCLSGKGVLHTRVRLPNSLELDIYNTHLQPFSSGKSIRAKQIKEILAHIKKTNNNKRAVILTGDFNIAGGNTEYHETMEILESNGFSDVWTQLNYHDPGHTWDSNINKWAQRNDGSYTSQHRFDYIFVRSTHSEKIDLIKSEVVFDKPLSLRSNSKKYFLSDHFGVDVTFKLSKD